MLRMDATHRDAEDASGVPVSRLARRKMRTRAALIGAAQTLIAQGRLNVPILEITQAADVGMGSFYNHFDSREQLYEAAVTDALDSYGALLDSVTASITDPAEAFATSFRLTGRLFRQRPQESALLLANWNALMLSDRGLSPRALRDITAAIDDGRFRLADPELALVLAGGALFGLGTLLRERPERDDAAAVDEVAQNLLRVFGVTPARARALCEKPLPEMSSLKRSFADGVGDGSAQ